jgi:NADH dehydrogenase (ubiquinone) 1 alpha subcomplex subunit 6
LRISPRSARDPILIAKQETLNYWKQLSHVMKYFRPEEDPGARLPPNFVSGFLEGRN